MVFAQVSDGMGVGVRNVKIFVRTGFVGWGWLFFGGGRGEGDWGGWGG